MSDRDVVCFDLVPGVTFDRAARRLACRGCGARRAATPTFDELDSFLFEHLFCQDRAETLR